jgi:hypothetical protein
MSEVVRKGLLFRAGQYPDKGYSMTPEELTAAAAAFSGPLKLDMEHTPTPLDGALGELRSVEVRDGVMYGEVALPTWLDGELEKSGNGRKVSCLWDRATKQLRGLSLVRTGRLEDAALMAAFSAAHPVEEQPAQRKGWLASLVAKFTRAAEETADEAAAEAKAAAEAAFTAEVARIRADAEETVKEQRRVAAVERAARVESESAAFADWAVTSERAMPAERDQLKAQFAQALSDDLASPAKFTIGNKEGGRADLLRSQVAARLPHGLGRELVEARPAAGVTILAAEFSGEAGPSGGNGMSAERKQKLMEMTSLGRSARGSN